MGNVSYSLSFIAQQGDNLETLSTQLGISQDEILEAHPELKGKTFRKGSRIGLGNLEAVQEINNTISSVAYKQKQWNCANFAGAANCANLNDQWTSTTENTGVFAQQLKSQYNSVEENDASIGSVIHYRLTDYQKTRNQVISQYVAKLKASGLSEAEIKSIITKPSVQSEITNVANWLMTNERHFSIVVLKDESGCVQNIIQKSGQIPFEFKVNHVNEVNDVLPYAPKPSEGTKTPYYTKKKN